MTADQILSLLIRLNETITAQQATIDALQAEVERLKTEQKP